MQEFKLPDLGEGMQEAEVRHWLVKPGDSVKLDQPIVEVETDKAVVEIPSPVAARVADIRVQEGNVAKLGEVLVTFETAARESVTGSAPPAITSNPIKAEPAQAQPAPVPVSTNTSTRKHRVLAAPAVRKRAFELGIDLEGVTPSHPSGRVTMGDVQSYAEHSRGDGSVNGAAKEISATNGNRMDAVDQARIVEPVASSGYGSTQVEQQGVVRQVNSVGSTPTEERQPLVGLRRRIAERMERSWRTIPHATSFDELDGTELVALRQVLKSIAQQHGIRLTYMPLLVKLLLPALKEFPIFNASMDEEKREIVYKRSYHVGIATDSPEGLLVPVLRDADQLTVTQIAKQLEHLIEGAQKRSLTVSEVSGSTFTLNNVGSFGGNSGTPIINYPEVAILAVGRLQEKAIVRNGTVLVRTMMPLAMSFDHRVIDGAMAGRFLTRFKELVEHPQQLMLDMV